MLSSWTNSKLLRTCEHILMSVWTMRIDRCIHIGTFIIFRPSTVEIAPPPLAELESRNPIIGLAQFLSIAPPHSSTCKRYESKSNAEVPITIRQKNSHFTTTIPTTTAAAAVPLSYQNPPRPLKKTWINPRPTISSQWQHRRRRGATVYTALSRWWWDGGEGDDYHRFSVADCCFYEEG